MARKPKAVSRLAQLGTETKLDPHDEAAREPADQRLIQRKKKLLREKLKKAD